MSAGCCGDDNAQLQTLRKAAVHVIDAHKAMAMTLANLAKSAESKNEPETAQTYRAWAEWHADAATHMLTEFVLDEQKAG